MTSEKKSVDSIIHARWVLPIAPENISLENHSIALNDGLIIALGPKDEIAAKYSSSQEYSFTEHAIMPGLINSHGHSAMALFRGLADDLPLMDWLNDHIWPAEGKWVSEDFVRDGTDLAIAEMLRGGTTCFSDMYFFPEVIAECASKAGIRVQACSPILDFPTVWGSGPDEYIEKTVALAAQYENDALVRIAFGPHAPYTVSDEPIKKVVAEASEKNIPVQIHLHETAFEVEEALKNTEQRPSERIAALGLLADGLNLQCVHVTQANDTDIELFAKANAHVLHCPESNLKLASGFCPTQKLLDAGVNVALGTDGAASNNDLDMFGEMRTAALLGKGVAGDASAIDAHTALAMATINGAKALGIDDVTGSLEVGKSADLIAIDLNQLNSQPLYDPASHLVYSAASQQVSHVWVAGKLRLDDGILVDIDAEALITKAKAWSDKIAKSDAEPQLK